MILLARLAPYLLALALAGALWWRYTSALERAEEAEARSALLEMNIAQQEAAREAIHKSYLRAQEAQTKLSRTVATLRANTRSQIARIDEVTRDATVRPWADVALPVPVRDLLRAAASAAGPASDTATTPGS